MITQKTLRGVRTPKSYILSGVRSSDGKRLDQDLNRNLGAEIAKISREKSELQQGLGGGNTMATYKLKRFSRTQKTYILKRKSFGVIGNVVSGVGTAAKNVTGTTLEAAGGAVEKTAKVVKPVAGLAGGLAGIAPGAGVGAALGSIVPVVGTALGAGIGAMVGAKGGSALAKGATEIVGGVGQSIKEGGQDLKGA